MVNLHWTFFSVFVSETIQEGYQQYGAISGVSGQTPIMTESNGVVTLPLY